MPSTVESLCRMSLRSGGIVRRVSYVGWQADHGLVGRRLVDRQRVGCTPYKLPR